MEYSKVEITVSEVCLFLFIQKFVLSVQLMLIVMIAEPGRIQREIA